MTKRYLAIGEEYDLSWTDDLEVAKKVASALIVYDLHTGKRIDVIESDEDVITPMEESFWAKE